MLAVSSPTFQKCSNFKGVVSEILRVFAFAPVGAAVGAQVRDVSASLEGKGKLWRSKPLFTAGLSVGFSTCANGHTLVCKRRADVFGGVSTGP
eukprot:XP_001690780.1 predicted protein [Chlamydomonas reinhardtii]